MLKIKDWLAPDIWRSGIASYAATASLGRKRWIPYLWLLDLARRLLPQIVAGDARIIVNAPPRNGKSEMISHWLPTWYIEQWPRKQIILSSYGGEFAGEWGKKVRDEFMMNSMCLAKLRSDSRATESWMTTEGGGMKTAGVGGPITGRGADLCFPAGTLIDTKEGPRCIEDIRADDFVLAFDHEKNEIVSRRVVAMKKTDLSEFVHILTFANKCFRATPEHKVFSPQHGYVSAKSLHQGALLLSSTNEEDRVRHVVYQRKIKSEPVYDIQVEGTNNFFAEGILVHNCIIDDPHKNWEEAMSPVSRERVIEWFNSTLYTRLEPHASIIVIQTRWHERDLSGYLINEHSDPWQLIKYPALSEGEGDILGRAEGEALCTPRFTAERLNEIKKVVGSHIFAGLYQQRPAPIMGGIVKKDWLRYWTELPANPDEWIQSWDLTFKATGTSYAVGQVWCRAKANYYLVDQIRGKMDFIEQLKQIAVLTRRWPGALTKVVEDAADAQAVKSTLDGTVPGIVLVRAHGSKEARLAGVVGAIESGNVYLPGNAPWLNEFVAELTTFPGTVNDDQVDALTLALDRLIQKSYDTDIRLPDLGRRANPWEAAGAEIN